ncbi:hypothetical protein DWUX_892 [Desulfovibrio diazotrophicus]|nr:hypothetical protein DWUX_892 [Desulfovibrio diazotrophicus]VVU43128.1 hypothetical protein DWUX_474 [Desulfovibrio diazotrophicus]
MGVRTTLPLPGAEGNGRTAAYGLYPAAPRNSGGCGKFPQPPTPGNGSGC